MKSKQRNIQVRIYQPGQTAYGSPSIGAITGDFGKYTVAETIRRTLRAEQIGNFCPLFCRFANNPRCLVNSDAGDLSDPFRRTEDYAETLWIAAPEGYTPPETIADLYRRDPAAACRRALRETAKGYTGSDKSASDRMDKINALLETFGVEAIQGEWQNGYWADIVATYCNTGDTYACTVLCVRGSTSFDSARFVISSCGDFVERNEKRLGIA